MVFILALASMTFYQTWISDTEVEKGTIFPQYIAKLTQEPSCCWSRSTPHSQQFHITFNGVELQTRSELHWYNVTSLNAEEETGKHICGLPVCFHLGFYLGCIQRKPQDSRACLVPHPTSVYGD